MSKKITLKTLIPYRNIRTVVLHTISGLLIFYFLIHPFTMVLYWFEFSNTPFSFSLFLKIVEWRFIESFAFHMVGMSLIMALAGLFMGIGSGLYWTRLQQSRKIIDEQYRQLNRDVRKLIESGENEGVEFKSSIRYDHHQKTKNRQLEVVIAKTIVGFMNAQGGKLIIGVSDTGEIIGLQDDYDTLKHKNKDGFERCLYEIIATYIGRQFCFKNHVIFYSIDDKEICMVDVEKLAEPVYLKDNEATFFFVRTGNATTLLPVKEAVEYIHLRKAKKYIK